MFLVRLTKLTLYSFSAHGKIGNFIIIIIRHSVLRALYGSAFVGHTVVTCEIKNYFGNYFCVLFHIYVTTSETKLFHAQYYSFYCKLFFFYYVTSKYHQWLPLSDFEPDFAKFIVTTKTGVHF